MANGRTRPIRDQKACVSSKNLTQGSAARLRTSFASNIRCLERIHP